MTSMGWITSAAGIGLALFTPHVVSRDIRFVRNWERRALGFVAGLILGALIAALWFPQSGQ